MLCKLDTRGLEVDILVINAGIIRLAPAAKHFDVDRDGAMMINLDAPFLLAHELSPRMVDRGSGKIVFLASVLPFRGGIRAPR